MSPPGAPARGQCPRQVLTEAPAATVNGWFYRQSTSGCPAWGAGAGGHTAGHQDSGCVSAWLCERLNVNQGNPWAPTGWGNGLGPAT